MMTPHQQGVVDDLWEIATGVWAPRLARLRPGNNGSYPVIAAYHRARRAIEATPDALAEHIAEHAAREFARIVSNAGNCQGDLFAEARDALADFGGAA